MFQVLQGIVSGLHILVSLAGVAVSAMYLGRTRWAGLLAGAFTLEAFVAICYRVLIYLSSSGTLSYSSVQPFYFVLGLLGVLAAAGIVAGVAFVLNALPAPVRAPLVPPQP